MATSMPSGDKLNASKTLEELSEVSKKKYVPAVYFAVIYIGLNRKDDAFLWLDKATKNVVNIWFTWALSPSPIPCAAILDSPTS